MDEKQSEKRSGKNKLPDNGGEGSGWAIAALA